MNNSPISGFIVGIARPHVLNFHRGMQQLHSDFGAMQGKVNYLIINICFQQIMTKKPPDVNNKTTHFY